MDTQAERDTKPYPLISCPECGCQMRLAMVEPDAPGDRMSFDCDCGFEYRMSDRARRGR